MNNEINNNPNNTENPSGINFVQGGVPTNNLPPQQPVYQTVGQAQAAPSPLGVSPASTIPQPVKPAPVNFVSTGEPTPVTSNPTPQPMQTGGAINPMPMAPTPGMPASPTPVNNPGGPMMPTQPMPTPIPTMPGTMPTNGMPNNNINATPEGEKPQLPIVMIIITVLVVVGVAVFLILFLTGKISFSRNNKPQVPAVKTQTEVVLADWMNYLLDKDITEIKISRYIDADNTKVVKLNKQQLKKVFTDMKNYNLIKYYSSSKIMSTDELQVTYTTSDAAYTFTLSGGYIDPGTDSDLKAFFENNNNISIEDDGTASGDEEDYNYILKNFDNKIYDAYFTENNEVDE